MRQWAKDHGDLWEKYCTTQTKHVGTKQRPPSNDNDHDCLWPAGRGQEDSRTVFRRLVEEKAEDATLRFRRRRSYGRNVDIYNSMGGSICATDTHHRTTQKLNADDEDYHGSLGLTTLEETKEEEKTGDPLRPEDPYYLGNAGRCRRRRGKGPATLTWAYQQQPRQQYTQEEVTPHFTPSDSLSGRQHRQQLHTSPGECDGEQ